jgi:transglutaminase-like putative cysteine protease
MDVSEFLKPGRFVDSDHPRVIAFAKEHAGDTSDPLAAAIRLHDAVRDGIIYDPYVDLADPTMYRASDVLVSKRTFCIGKSALLAASARVIGIPARPGYADVRNHLTSKRLYEMIKTDTFAWHSFTELYLNGRWVKATPVFDQALCQRAGITPLDFDGVHDSLMHPFDPSGRKHMEYLRQRGSFADVPFETIQADFSRDYPSLMKSHGLSGDFHAEAVAEVMADK